MIPALSTVTASDKQRMPSPGIKVSRELISLNTSQYTSAAVNFDSCCQTPETVPYSGAAKGQSLLAPVYSILDGAWSG
jgi:hypothetical protein